MGDESTYQPAESFAIDDVETLQIITDETRIEIIELLRHPLSVAQIAEKMGVPRTRLYHHIKLLEDIGAVVVVDERRAGAMTEKIYGVAARSFQPSKTFLESATPKEQATAIVDSLFSITRNDFLRAVDRGRVSLDEDQARQQVSISRRVFHLSPERRAELIQRFDEVFAEFAEDEKEPDDDVEAFGVLIFAHPSSRSTP